MDDVTEGQAWLRLTEACKRLRAAGVGEADILPTIAYAGLRGQLIATGFPSAHIGTTRHRSNERDHVRSIMWRVLSSKKAAAAGYERFVSGEDLVWTLTTDEGYRQEAWRCVFVDRASFAALLADASAKAKANLVSDGETAEWIETYPGQYVESAWEAFRKHFGARAGARAAFRAVWKIVRGTRGKGRPRKNAETSDFEAPPW